MATGLIATSAIGFQRNAASEELEPEPEQDDRDQSEEHRYSTTQNPFGLPLNGMPPTFIPQMLAISVAGRNITEKVVNI
jgi:hypothetical protein